MKRRQPRRTIQDRDLEKVLAALKSGSLAGLNTYQSALLAVTTMIAANHLTYPGRTFGSAIRLLVVEPGTPENLTGAEVLPWRNKRRMAVIAASRELKLHVTADHAGNDATVQTVNALVELLRDPEVQGLAAAWFDRYMPPGARPEQPAIKREQLPEHAPGQELPQILSVGAVGRRLAMQLEISEDPVLGSQIAGLDEFTLREVLDRLGPILNRYFPRVAT